MTDIWQPWRDLLKGRSVAIHDGEPLPGFYKTRTVKNGPWLPVAIWEHEGQIVARRGNDMVPADKVWPHCARFPMPQEHCKAWFETGRWPDDPEPVTPVANRPADPFEALIAEVDERIAQARRLVEAPITDKVECDKRTNTHREITALIKRADAMHAEEKRPHLEKCREVDRRYDFRKVLDDWGRRLRQAYGAWMAAEERRQREEAQRRYEAEKARVEAERKRLEEERAKRVDGDPLVQLIETPPPLPDMPSPPEPVKVQAGGGVGRAAGLRTEWTPEITDYRAAALYVIEHDEVREAVGKVIARLVKASKGSIKIPGVTVKQDRVAA